MGSAYAYIIRINNASIKQVQDAIGGNFVGQREPLTKITDYIQRFIKHKKYLGIDKEYPTEEERADACKTVLLYTAIYIDRVRHRIYEARKIDILTPLTVHRIFVAAITLANKYLNDFLMVNEEISELSGINIKNLNALEIKFLRLITFDLFISFEDYEAFSTAVESSLAQAMEISPDRNPEDLISEECSADSQSYSSSSHSEDPDDYSA